jgi:hypothetical protein
MMQKGPVSVLVAPLDWGLGHATRCIPIIKELTLQGAEVIVAASGNQKALLIQEFPGLEILEIPGYGIRYKQGILLKWALALKVPFILKQIRRENKWLEQTRQQHSIDAVISDNRYGLFSRNLYTVFITHQLCIQSGKNAEGTNDGMVLRKWIGDWVDRLILKWNYKFIGKFSCCWVPDQEGIHSVGGKLSQPSVLPSVPVKYIGILSRFKLREKKQLKNSLLIILSGPEPQRTQFENILFEQLKVTALQTLVVRGLPGSGESIPFIQEGISIFNHLPSDALNEKLSEAEFIIARSGYSTVMDLIKLKKNAILVPTPGQTEQEYLGAYLNQRRWMYSVPQKNFNLEKVLGGFKISEMEIPDMPASPLGSVIREFLQTVEKNKNNIDR